MSPHPLQLRDLDGHRFVASCRCGYRAVVLPETVIASRPDARFWTTGELALHLRCRRCKARLIREGEEITEALIRKRLPLERHQRGMLGFQAGMVLPQS